MKSAMRDGAFNLKEPLALTTAGYKLFGTEGRACNQGEIELAKNNKGCHEHLAAPQLLQKNYLPQIAA
jgi:hypothetical protein